VHQAIQRIWNFAYRSPDTNKIQMANWPFTIKTVTDELTEANVEAYDLPTDCREIAGILHMTLDGSPVYPVSEQEYQGEDYIYTNVFVIRDGHFYLKVVNAAGEYGPPETSGQALVYSYISKPTLPTILSRGSITLYATGSAGYTVVTSASHGLANDAYVTIVGTANYDGTYKVSAVATNTFTIPCVFTQNDTKGTWMKTGVMPTPDMLDEAVAKIAFGTCIAKAGKKGEGNAEISEAIDLLMPFATAGEQVETVGFKGYATSTRS
jgi:hypothetical protein